MPIERTLCIIKPDALAKNKAGEIISRIEQSGLRLAAARMLHLSTERAEGFYAEHRGKPFYEGLVQFMSSGPIMALALEGEAAIEKYRRLMGPTNSPEGAPGTIRRDFGTDNRRNAVHGSDSPASASREISYFFSDAEIFSRY